MKYDSIDALRRLGFAYDDATALRRISMTLHRWHELECGDGNDHGSWAIARGHKKNGAFEYDDGGAPYLEYHSNSSNGATYRLIGDREKGARKRLAAIMARYPQFAAYVQGDPRGAALYILDKATTPQPYDQFYSRGVVVCK